MSETLKSPVSLRKAVHLRSVEPGDEAFLVRVYAGERAEELALLPWEEPQKRAFVGMQLAAQLRHYREHYPSAQQTIICADGKPAGRLYLDKGPAEFRILDIAVLPEERKAGVGTLVLRDIQNEARALGLPVTIFVEAFNPSLRFLEQLGFRKVSQEGFHVLMRWGLE